MRQLSSKTKASDFGNRIIARTGEQTVAKQPKGELVVIGFNYDVLENKVADKVRNAADRIRERIKKTVEDIIEVGNDLLAVKETLPHGQFLPWLKAEFGWSERSAQNFMSVAEQFKSAKIADLPIQPSAAYLLAAPSIPDEAPLQQVQAYSAGRRIARSGLSARTLKPGCCWRAIPLAAVKIGCWSVHSGWDSTKMAQRCGLA